MTLIINPYRFAVAGGTAPDAITDASLIGWYRSDSIVESGGNLTQWDDKSANGFDLSSLGGTPTIASADLDGFDAVDFSTSDRAYDSTDLSASFGSNTHFFLLVRPDAYTSGRAFLHADYTGSNSNLSWARGDGTDMATVSESAVTVSPTGAPSTGNYGLYEGLIKSNDTVSARWDNGTADSASIGTLSGGVPRGISLGAAADGGDNADGAIVELCVFDDEITTERDDLLNYFLGRYATLSFSV